MTFKNKRKNWFDKLKKKVKSFFVGQDNTLFNTIEVTVLILISILFGVIVGCILTYGRGLAIGIDDKYAKELINTYDTILNNYYNDVTEEELMNAAINGMIASLEDEYSYYMNATDTFSFNQRVDGSYVGVGATISFSEDGNIIVELFKNSPAEKAGLKVGDIILAIDDVDVSSEGIEKVSSLLIGEANTTVSVKVKRDNEEKSVKLVRDVIEIPSVFSKLVKEGDKNIGFIDIDTFAANTYSQFNKHLNKLEKQNIDGLIIDVRDNSGGHLNQVNKILSLFFDNKTVLYKIESKDGIENVYSTGKKNRKYDIVVLMNNSSASASEILVSCFQENYKNATIVGLTSYGKGTIQSAIKLSTGSSLKYTSQKWLTSKGKWLNGVGLAPDEEVKIDSSVYSVADVGDSQFERALQILSE